ncbi:MAG: T9SS type A sorting domain-containing protein [Lewinellaceae bacterium]|nr:T9SS type A sorting domain-containing protein [Lewinellaceae bacterium]
MKRHLFSFSFFLLFLLNTIWGQCWELVYDDYEDVFNYTFFEDIHFINDSIGWACGFNIVSGGIEDGFYMKTTDGGDNWEMFTPSGPYPNNIFFTDEQNGCISANSLSVTYWTNNGGEDWYESAFDLAPGQNGIIGGLFFINRDTGWISAWNVSTQRTTDGGRTWQAQSPSPDLNAREIHFVDENNGWIIGNSGFNGRLYHTADGGESWELQLSMFRDYFDVFFLTPQLGWVAAEDNSVCRSTDGGYTWDCYPIMGEELLGPVSIYFANDTLGWIGVAPNKGIFVTTDGGESWKQHYTLAIEENEEIFVQEVFMTSDTVGYFCTRKGKIYRYRGRPAPCGPALLPVQDSSLFPLLRWPPAEGCFDGYYLQLGTAPGGDDILPRTDVGWDTAYQLTEALPPSTQLFATIVPYNHVYGAAEGCSSTAFTTIDCPPAPAVIDTGFCEGEAFHFMHTVFEEPGAYPFPFTDAQGCDSTITLQLAAWPVYSLTLDTALQAGTPFQGVVYEQDTSFIQHYASAQGCDSTVAVNINILVNAESRPAKPAPALRLFPNPATEVLHLELDGFPAGRTWLSIRSSAGQLIQQESLRLSEGEVRHRINLAGWPPGVYFVSVLAGESVQSGRLVKLP